MNIKKKVSKDLTKILIKAIQKKIYGSVEVYFEGGNITQITQRIINKVQNIKQNGKPKITQEATSPQKAIEKKKNKTADSDSPQAPNTF